MIDNNRTEAHVHFVSLYDGESSDDGDGDEGGGGVSAGGEW